MDKWNVHQWCSNKVLKYFPFFLYRTIWLPALPSVYRYTAIPSHALYPSADIRCRPLAQRLWEYAKNHDLWQFSKLWTIIETSCRITDRNQDVAIPTLIILHISKAPKIARDWRAIFVFIHHSQENCIFLYIFLQENLLNSKIYCNFAANLEKEIENKSKIKWLVKL